MRLGEWGSAGKGRGRVGRTGGGRGHWTYLELYFIYLVPGPREVPRAPRPPRPNII